MGDTSDKTSIRRILGIDIGGSGLKAAVVDTRGKMLTDRGRVDTPHDGKPEQLVELVTGLVAGLGSYDRIAIGFPGYVRDGTVFTAPNLDGEAWAGFNLARTMEERLGRPARLFNDADLQGLAAIDGRGLELVCTLGTGCGTAWFSDGELMPHMELAHIPFHNGKDLDAFIGEAAREKVGNKKWNQRLEKVIAVLSTVLNYDHLYLGGGNAEKVSIDLPKDITVVSNLAGLEGASFAWVPRR